MVNELIIEQICEIVETAIFTISLNLNNSKSRAQATWNQATRTARQLYKQKTQSNMDEDSQMMPMEGKCPREFQ